MTISIGGNFFLGGRRSDLFLGSDENDFVDGRGGQDILFGFGGDDTIFGGRGRDSMFGGDGDDEIDAGRGSDFVFGGSGDDTIDAGRGADFILGGSGQDFITTGRGRDIIAFEGDPFDGTDVSADGRDIVGGEDFIADFNFRKDAYLFDGNDFGVEGGVRFASLDANAAHPGDTAEGTNVIVLLNSDNDDNPDTPFLAGTAANQIAEIVETDGAGFFVYFNSNLGVNRLVYSTNLNDASADLKIISRQTDLEGHDAIDALARFSADNFAISDEDILLTEDDDDFGSMSGTSAIYMPAVSDDYAMMADDAMAMAEIDAMWA